MNNLLLQLLLLILGSFDRPLSGAEIEVFINVLVITLLFVHHIGHICISFKVIVHLISFIIAKTPSIVSSSLQAMLSKSELVLQAHLAESD